MQPQHCCPLGWAFELGPLHPSCVTAGQVTFSEPKWPLLLYGDTDGW